MDADEQCGPYHSDCDCIYECRGCFGRLEQGVVMSDSGRDSIDYWCADCFYSWTRADVRQAGSGVRRAEQQKLAEWTAWATQR